MHQQCLLHAPNWILLVTPVASGHPVLAPLMSPEAQLHERPICCRKIRNLDHEVTEDDIKVGTWLCCCLLLPCCAAHTPIGGLMSIYACQDAWCCCLMDGLKLVMHPN
jgi:hypothetical protein